MKTSINIPEWLYEKVQATCPDIPFGTLARDALIIALPEWDKHGPDGATQRALEVELRLLTARAAQEGVTLPQSGLNRPLPAGQRKAQASAPAPARAGQKRAAPKSGSKAAALANLPGSESK